MAHRQTRKTNKMKARILLCSLVIASLGAGAGTAAFAQPGHGNDHRDDHGRGHDTHQMHRDDRHDQRDDHRDAREERHFYNARSAEFRRGGRLPGELRNRQYVVSNWRAHRLSAPPRGYQWVQVGPDYVLASIASGIIANLILNH
jgi:Ni/Co efflux regulator RcnB